MARPKKTTDERRDDQLKTRLTTAERVEIERNASLLGVSPAEFMRRRALGYRLPVALVEQRQRALLATALLRVGVNLNQLTRHVNAGNLPPLDLLRAVLVRINVMLDEIYGPGTDGGQATPS